MSSYQNIINDFRNIRDNVKFEYINNTRDNQVYHQFITQTQQSHSYVYGTANYNGSLNSILSNFFGTDIAHEFSMGSFFSSPSVSISYGTIPMAQSNYAPLNLFDAMTQMMNQMQHVNQEDVKLVLKKHELDKLPKLTPEELMQAIPTLTKDDVCPLCLENYFNDKEMLCSILSCGHHFCYPCIYKELSEYRHVCPLCKNNVGEYEAKI